MSDVLVAIGLLLDIAGVVLLWRFGLPAEVSRTGASSLLLEETDEAQIGKARRYDQLSHLAIGLLVTGFTLQLVGTLT